MEDFKGTPGPWKTDDRYEDSTEIVDSKGFSHVTAEPCAILLGWDEHFQHWSDSKEAHRDISREEQRANAKLIAAAPELLESLQKLRDYAEDVCGVCPDDCHEEHPLMMATAAIAKALGKE